MKGLFKILITAALFTLIAVNSKAETGKDWSWDPYAPAMKSATIAQIADIGSTALALIRVENALEGNPLQWYALPAKGILIYGLFPLLSSEHQVVATNILNNIAYGATVNNLIIAAGVEGAFPIIGGVLTMTYLFACDARWLPLSICPFTETVLEEITRLYLDAEREGRTIDRLLFKQWEMDELVELVGYEVNSFNGIALEVVE